MTATPAAERCPTCDREGCLWWKSRRGIACPVSCNYVGCSHVGVIAQNALDDCSRNVVDWRARALAAEAERSAILALVSPSSDQSLPDAVRELCEQVEELRGRIATVAAAIEHDVAIKRGHDSSRATGGQTCGTGGPLTPATQSVLRYLDGVVRDLHDGRTRTIADDAARWAKVAPLIEALRKFVAHPANSGPPGQARIMAAVRTLLAATEPTP